MNLLEDIITYMRRIIKTPSNESITTDLLIDYVNRFYTVDVSSRMNLFDLKTNYQFLTTPGVDRYNMPLYDIQTEPGGQTVNFYPVYQGFEGPCFVNGISTGFYTQRNQFNNIYPNYFQTNLIAGYGNGDDGPYTLSVPVISNISNTQNQLNGACLLRGHVDITGIINTGNNIDPPVGTGFDNTIPTTSVNSSVYFSSTSSNGENVVIADSGQFLSSNTNLGLLMQPGNAPYGNLALPNNYFQSFVITGITQSNPAILTSSTTFGVGQTIQISGVVGMTELNGNTYTVIAVDATTVTINVDSTGFTPYISDGQASSEINCINYFTGIARNVFFPTAIPNGYPIYANCYYYQLGIPRSILYYNNVITVRPPPNTQYVIDLTAYLSPAAFLRSSQGVNFAYMTEYLARGAARKLLSDIGDWTQFNQYEPLFLEQEKIVWVRSQRQFTSTRVQTIYSSGTSNTTMGSGYGIGLQ